MPNSPLYDSLYAATLPQLTAAQIDGCRVRSCERRRRFTGKQWNFGTRGCGSRPTAYEEGFSGTVIFIGDG